MVQVREQVLKALQSARGAMQVVKSCLQQPEHGPGSACMAALHLLLPCLRASWQLCEFAALAGLSEVSLPCLEASFRHGPFSMI